MALCSVKGCTKKRVQSGLCWMHYYRFRRHGTFEPGRPVRTGTPRRPPEERFWEMVEKNTPSGCWIWIGSLNTDRYPHFCIGGRWGKTVLCHRYSYELVHGHIPAGMQIDHLCRNIRCVRPSHMEVVPPKVNVLRGNTIVATNAAKTHCKRGHPFTPENTRLENGSRRCKECRRLKQRQLREH